MLTLVQNKTLDALEYALLVIEEYDKEFQQKNKGEGNEENQKEGQEKSGDFQSRFSDVKTSCKELFNLQKERAVNFVTKNAVYKYADEKVDFTKRYNSSVEFTENVYRSFSTQIVVPLQENVVFMYDTSREKASLVVKNLQNSLISQAIIQRFSSARVTLSQNWMKLDFNEDGRVTMADITSAFFSVKDILAQYKYFKEALELPQTFRQKALGYIQSEKSGENDEVAKRLNSDSSNDSNESIELANLNEKDD